MPGRDRGDSLRAVRQLAEAALSTAQGAVALAHEALGWDGRSTKDHIERVEGKAVATQNLADEVAELRGRVHRADVMIASLVAGYADLEARFAAVNARIGLADGRFERGGDV